MILEAKNISLELGNRTVLDDISMASKPGKLIGLIGPNGAGKSTFLRVMGGLKAPSSGHVELDKVLLNEIKANERARKIAYLPQEHIVNWPISVYDLVAMGRLPFVHPLAALDQRSKAAIEQALAAMSVENLVNRSALELSGGELARVLLARALAQTPQILLADEPTAGLDPAHKLHLLSHLAKTSTSGMSIIIVLHDLSMAARFCDHLVLLQKGRVYKAGTPDEVLTKKALREVYHIKVHIDEVRGHKVILPLNVEETTS